MENDALVYKTAETQAYMGIVRKEEIGYNKNSYQI